MVDQVAVLQQVLQEDVGCGGVHCPSGSRGGILNECYVFETDKGKFFGKVNQASALPMYEAEARGLKSLRETQTVRVPEPVIWGAKEGCSFLIMEYIPLSSHTPSSQKELGTQLARMHLKHGADRFGYEVDNTIGTTPQINTWKEDWAEFFITQRLEYQLNLLEKQKGDSEIRKMGDAFIRRYSPLLEGIEVAPSLLHGDLWSGNTAADDEGRPVIYDPAVYYGHHEAEFGILLLFGGFPQDFHQAYRELIPKEPGFEERQLGYQLYHFLNHYNLFGSSYRPSCMSLLTRL